MIEPPTPDHPLWTALLVNLPQGGCPAPPIGNPANNLGPAVQNAVCNPTTPAPPDASNPIPSFLRDSIFGDWIEDFRRGVTDAIKSAITFWVTVPGPDLGDENGNLSDTVGFLRDSVGWLAGTILVFAVIVTFTKMMWSRDPERTLGHVLAQLGVNVAVIGVSIPVIVMLSEICDSFSEWIIERSTGDSTALGDALLVTLFSPIGSGTVMLGVLGIATLVAGLQVIIMLARGAILIILAGTLTVTAAAWGTDVGRQAFRHQVGWIAAWLLVKPAAAIIYATGFRLVGQDGSTPTGFISICQGLTVLFLAIFTLPALLRLICPLTSPASQGQGVGPAVVKVAGFAAMTR